MHESGAINNGIKSENNSCNIPNHSNSDENSSARNNGCEATNEKQDTRYPDGTIKLRNPHIAKMEKDTLYHLGFSTDTHELKELFGDVKFVCMGGATKRMEKFAQFIMNEIEYKLPLGATLTDISSYRFCMYKVGPVLSISHGMGPSSIAILLHEIIKLLYYAKVKDPIFFRIGTCGGIGLEPGTVIITKDAVDGMMNRYYEEKVLGRRKRWPAKLDESLVEELKTLIDPNDPYTTVAATTMCASDFYEGQGRLDGIFCDYNEEDKMEFLNNLYKNGVRNIEMEAIPFAAFTHHAGIKAADICVTFIDRLKDDQVFVPKETLEKWQMRPQILVARYIKRSLQQSDKLTNNNQCGTVARRATYLKAN